MAVEFSKVSATLPLTAQAYEYLFNESWQGLQSINVNDDEIKTRLEELQKGAEACANAMLSGFKDLEGGDIPSREASLQAKIQELATITKKLNGPNYWQAFGDALRKAPPYTQQYLESKQKFDIIFNELAKDPTIVKDVDQEIAPQIARAFYQGLISTRNIELEEERQAAMARTQAANKAPSGPTRAAGSYYAFNFGNTLDDLSERMRMRFIRDVNREDTPFAKILSQHTGSNEITMQVTEKNIYSILHLAPKQAKEFLYTYDQNGELLNDIKRIFKEVVIKELALGDATHIKNMNRALEIVLDQQDRDTVINNLFVGAQAGGLLGLLGEVQAVFYGLSLLDPAKADVAWTGGVLTSGVKPHADVLYNVLKQSFGVQVKNISRESLNAMSEEAFDIDFQSFNATATEIRRRDTGLYDYFFTKEAGLNAQMLDIPSDVLTWIWNIHTMRQFNVPYQWNPTTKKVEQLATPQDIQNQKNIGWRRYNGTYINLHDDKVDQLIGKIMVQYVAGLIYLQTGLNEVNTSNPQANTLFIIAGGKKVMTAYTILTKLIDELKTTIQSLSFSSVYTSPKSGNGTGTIVEFINQQPTKDGHHVFSGAFALQTSFRFA